MKKILALILALCVTVPFAACQKQDNAGNTPEVPEVENTDSTPTNTADKETTPAESETSEDNSIAVMTYDEYVKAELDTPVVVETYVQAKQSWWEDKATIYTQSPDGAYFIYEMACPEEDYDKLVKGTKIRVSGFKGEWAGEVEIMDSTFEIIEGDTFIAEPVDVTEFLGKEELITYQNQYVSFKNLTIEASKDAEGNEVAFLYSYDGSGQDGNDLYFNVSDGNDTYTFTVESYLCYKTTDVYTAVKSLEIGDIVDMEGFLYWYEGVNPHITAVKIVE